MHVCKLAEGQRISSELIAQDLSYAVISMQQLDIPDVGRGALCGSQAAIGAANSSGRAAHPCANAMREAALVQAPQGAPEEEGLAGGDGGGGGGGAGGAAGGPPFGSAARLGRGPDLPSGAGLGLRLRLRSLNTAPPPPAAWAGSATPSLSSASARACSAATARSEISELGSLKVSQLFHTSWMSPAASPAPPAARQHHTLLPPHLSPPVLPPGERSCTDRQEQAPRVWQWCAAQGAECTRW